MDAADNCAATIMWLKAKEDFRSFNFYTSGQQPLYTHWKRTEVGVDEICEKVSSRENITCADAQEAGLNLNPQKAQDIMTPFFFLDSKSSATSHFHLLGKS